jgi:pSer/pThr/pTyr-binding forkhead associated (FHA) protein
MWVFAGDSRHRPDTPVGEADLQSPRVARLVGTGLPPEGVELVGPLVRIGRSPDNEIELDVEAVSRAHLRLEQEAGVWRAVDLESTNGSEVDGARLRPWHPHPLSHGAVINLAGAARLDFLLGEHERAGGIAATLRVADAKAVRLTPAETEVLELLFVHYDEGRAAPRIATVAEVAGRRFTSSAAVKMALQSLYDKFDLAGDDRNKETLAIRAQDWRATRPRT